MIQLDVFGLFELIEQVGLEKVLLVNKFDLEIKILAWMNDHRKSNDYQIFILFFIKAVFLVESQLVIFFVRYF